MQQLTSLQVLNMIEERQVKRGTVFQDFSGNKLMFNGEHLDIIHLESEVRYTGFCVDKKWSIINA